jgi:hypothetical protein
MITSALLRTETETLERGRCYLSSCEVLSVGSWQAWHDNPMEFVLDSDESLSRTMDTEILATHYLVPEEQGDALINSFVVKACLFD